MTISTFKIKDLDIRYYVTYDVYDNYDIHINLDDLNKLEVLNYLEFNFEGVNNKEYTLFENINNDLALLFEPLNDHDEELYEHLYNDTKHMACLEELAKFSEAFDEEINKIIKTCKNY